MLLFEVIAQRPIAEHFEKGGVAVVADFVDILGAQTCLAVGDARAFRMRFAQKVRNHRLHAAAGKQGGRIILRHQQSARYNDMSIFFAKIEIGVTDLLSVHIAPYFNRLEKDLRAQAFLVHSLLFILAEQRAEGLRSDRRARRPHRGWAGL